MTVVESVASEESATAKVPPGVLVEGPVVDAKFRDSYISFALMITGSIAALVWVFTQGIGWVEVSVFAGMFALTTVGTLVSYGGLGNLIRDGVQNDFKAEILAASVLCVVLAVVLDTVIVGAQWLSTPWTHRRRTT